MIVEDNSIHFSRGRRRSDNYEKEREKRPREDGRRKPYCIAMVRMSRQHHVFVIRETATVPDVLRWEERDRRLIRLITDEERRSERGRGRKRLQAAGCIVRATRKTIPWLMNATKIQRIFFFVAPDRAATRECSERDGAIPRQRKNSASRYQSLSCNMRAIRTRDYTLTLATRVRNGEKEREIVVEERRTT